MTGQDLKNSILQLAIQGKLVAQDANDEPASVLLEKIKAEKKKLIEEKKIKKEKPLPEITEDEMPFEIPDSWMWVRLGEIFQTSSGSTPLTSNPLYYGGNINWTRTTDLNNGALYQSEKKITEKALEECNLNIIPRDSVCVAMYGGAGTIGKYSIIKFDTTINQSVCAIYPNGLCSMDFVLYFMQYQRPNWMNFAAGSRKDPNINKIIIKNCIFPLPPLSEQKRIVAKIEELMPLVDEYDKAQKELDALNSAMPEQLKQSILQEAIMGKLGTNNPDDEPASVLLQRIREEKAQLIKDKKIKKEKPLPEITEDEIPFEIPDNWVWVRISELALVARGGSPRPIKEYLTESNDGINWIKIGDTEKGGKYINSCAEKIKPSGVSKSRIVHIGDFLLTNSMSFGRPYITNVEGCIHDGWLVISQYLPTYNQDFFFYLLSSPFAYSQFCDKTAGAVVQNLNKDKVAESVFPLPPLAEQKRIVSKIENLFACIEPLAKDVK